MRFSLCFPACFALVLSLAPVSAFATQDAASTVRSIKKEVGFKTRDAKVRQVKQGLVAKEKSEKPAEKQADFQKITVKKTEFSPSKILSEAELAPFQKKLDKKSLTLAEIKTVLAEINRIYADKGFIAARAFAAVKDDVLRVRLMEPVADKITVVKNKTTDGDFVSEKIGIRSGDLINMDAFREKLLWFNTAHDIGVRLAFEPGESFGTTAIEENVAEPEPYGASVFADNYGSDDTGKNRIGAFAVVRSLTGLRDTLNVGAVKSKGSTSLFGGYEIPVPFTSYLRFGIGGDWSETEIVSGSMKNMDMTGKYHDAYAYLKHPVFVSDTVVSTMTVTATAKRGDTLISRARIQRSDTDTVALSGDLLYLIADGYWFNQLSVTRGVSLFEGNTRFTYAAYDGDFRQTFADGFLYAVRASAGFSDDGDRMPSSESFQIGGMTSVRGYDGSFLTGEKGFSVSVEAGFDVSKLYAAPFVRSAQVFGFFDYGRIFDKTSGDSAVEKPIYSAGAGVRVYGERNWECDLTAAFPLADHAWQKDDKVKFLAFIKAVF